MSRDPHYDRRGAKLCAYGAAVEELIRPTSNRAGQVWPDWTHGGPRHDNEAMLEGHPNHRPCRLAPPEAFSDELARKGLRGELLPDRDPDRIETDSETVSRVFASRCAGDAQPPSAAELYRAMRREEPTEREHGVLCSWVMHATIDDLWWAWAERVYSWRMLARAIERSGLPWWEAYRYVNAHAERQEMVPDDAFPVV